MAIILDETVRNVIPNWRDFKRTLKLGELADNSKKTIKAELNIDISRARNDWKLNKSIGVAADLINSAFISQKVDIDEVKEAANFIINNGNFSNTPLTELAQRIINPQFLLNGGENKIELEVDDFTQFQSLLDKRVLYKLIKRTKDLSIKEYRNPIVWVDLSRLYSFLGQSEKAIKSMEVALSLAPSNRFVLRSATRLFVHVESGERALYYLRKSAATKVDPWLISAHIATSSTIKRFSPMIKEAKKLVLSNNFSSFDLTELNSALGTLEYFDGSLKDAKKYFHYALKQPNDNSLAQIEWISKKEKRFDFNPFDYNNVINPFEAFALDNYQKGKWEESYKNCVGWLLDIPYSREPVVMGSYVASLFLDDYESAIKLCKIGLIANPQDHTILNNIAYSYALNNEITNAVFYLDQLNKIIGTNTSDIVRVTVKATAGLIEFRKKDYDNGKRLYREAIEESEKLKDEFTKFLAMYHYLKELMLINDPEKEFIFQKIQKIKLEKLDFKVLKFILEKLYKDTPFSKIIQI